MVAIPCVPPSRGPPRRGFAVLPDARLHLRPEMADKALDGPGRGIAQCADRMPLDLVGDVEQHVDLGNLGLAFHHSLHDPPHPSRALPAGGALAATFVLV